MAKKKSGRIAIPFLTTLFIGLLIVGGAAFYLMKMINKKEPLKTPPARDGKYATYADSHTVLLVLDTTEKDVALKDGEVDDTHVNDCNVTFLLMRSVPKERKIYLFGLPSTSFDYISELGGERTLGKAYREGGAMMAVKYAEKIMGISIPKYLVVGEESFKRICDMMGCVNTYPVDVKMPGYEGDNSLENLNSEEILTYVTRPNTADNGDERVRARQVSAIIMYMINGTNGNSIADNLKSNFNSIIDMDDVSTNITSVDYNAVEKAVQEMFRCKETYSMTVCDLYILPCHLAGASGYRIGSETDDEQQLQNQLQKIREEYFSHETRGDSQ